MEENWYQLSRDGGKLVSIIKRWRKTGINYQEMEENWYQLSRDGELSSH
jgi:hypothetical protein